MQNTSLAKENIEIVNWSGRFLNLLSEVITKSQLIENAICNSNKEKYFQLSKGIVFNQYTAINVFIDNILNHMKEETVSVKISLEPLKMILGKLEEQMKVLKDCVKENHLFFFDFKNEIMKMNAYSFNIYLIMVYRNCSNDKIEKTCLKLKDIYEKIQYSKFFFNFNNNLFFKNNN